MIRKIQIAGASLFVILAGCRSGPSSSTGSMEDALSISAAAPLIRSYTAIEGMNRGYQSSAIALEFPDPMFASRVTKDELIEIARRHGWKFHEPWLYMGSENNRHYFALYPFGGFRRIYSVPDDQWKVNDPFILTSQAAAWREIRIVPDGRMMRNLWIMESDDPVRFFVPERDPTTFFEQEGQQIDDGNAEKPSGDLRTP